MRHPPSDFYTWDWQRQEEWRRQERQREDLEWEKEEAERKQECAASEARRERERAKEAKSELAYVRDEMGSLQDALDEEKAYSGELVAFVKWKGLWDEYNAWDPIAAFDKDKPDDHAVVETEEW